MRKIELLLQELETKIPLQNVLQTSVSASSIGWHIEHTLLTINKIAEATKISNADNYKFVFKPLKYIVYLTRKIPRGKAKNPKLVEPEFFDEITLKNHLQKTKTSILELVSIEKNKYFKHPFFGNLKLNDTIKFFEIHTMHHLKIINDIQQAASK
jgi:hypothetical protein